MWIIVLRADQMASLSMDWKYYLRYGLVFGGKVAGGPAVQNRLNIDPERY